jgi:hypothetical protein
VGSQVRSCSRGVWLAAVVICFTVLIGRPASGQAPDAFIEENLTDDAYAGYAEEAARLRSEGKLLDAEAVRAALAAPAPQKFQLAPKSDKPLASVELARRARAALVRVGWIYRDAPTDEWQLDLAGGYAVSAEGVVATCRHVVDPDYLDPIVEGSLIAVDAAGTVLSVTAVLAADEEMDAVLLKVAGGRLTPVPLNDAVAVGEPVWSYSDPMGVPGFFDQGIVNRVYWFDAQAGKDPNTLVGARNLRIHVSVDWAPGSSGSAVFDECGNAIGQVSEIESLLDDPSDEDDSAQDVPDDDAPAADSAGDAKGSPGSDDAADGAAASEDEGSGAAEDSAFDHIRRFFSGEQADPYADSPATMMVLHVATPARGVRLLSEACNSAAAASDGQ